MYERFYNFRERPFYLSRDSPLVALNRVHRETEDTDAYINSQLERVAIGEPLRFPPDVTELVHALSGGIPRVVSVICDAVLLVGYAEERRNIDCALVQDVMHELVAAGVLHQKQRGVTDLAHPASSPSRAELELMTKAGTPAAPVAAVDPRRPPSPPIPVAKPDRRAAERELAQATRELDAREAELRREREELIRREDALYASEAALARRERQIAEQRRIMNEEYRLLRASGNKSRTVNQRGFDEPDCGYTAESHPAP